MHSHVELERYGRNVVAARHREAARHRLLRTAQRSAHGDATYARRGLRHGVARLLRSVAARIDPSQESDPAAA